MFPRQDSKKFILHFVTTTTTPDDDDDVDFSNSPDQANFADVIVTRVFTADAAILAKSDIGDFRHFVP
jgi:hypothetical protein